MSSWPFKLILQEELRVNTWLFKYNYFKSIWPPFLFLQDLNMSLPVQSHQSPQITWDKPSPFSCLQHIMGLSFPSQAVSVFHRTVLCCFINLLWQFSCAFSHGTLKFAFLPFHKGTFRKILILWLEMRSLSKLLFLCKKSPTFARVINFCKSSLILWVLGTKETVCLTCSCAPQASPWGYITVSLNFYTNVLFGGTKCRHFALRHIIFNSQNQFFQIVPTVRSILSTSLKNT